MNKRIIAAVIALAAAFALAACGSSDSKSVKLAEDAPAGAAAEASDDKIETPKAGEAADNEIRKDDAEKASDEDKDRGTDAEDADKENEAENEKIQVPEGVVAPEKMLDKEWTGTVSADGDGLNLRSGPDSDYEEIDLIPDDTEVDILAEQDGWGFTSFKDQYGWIFLEWVEKQL